MLWLYMLSPRSSPSLQRKSRNLMPLNTYTIVKPGQKQPASFLRKIKAELWRAGTILLGIKNLNSSQPHLCWSDTGDRLGVSEEGVGTFELHFSYVTSYAMMALSFKMMGFFLFGELGLKENAITFGSVSLEFAFISLKVFAGVKTGSNGST